MTRLSKKGGNKETNKPRPAPPGETDSQIPHEDNGPGPRKGLRLRKNPKSYNELFMSEESRPGDDGSDTSSVPGPSKG